MLEEEEDARSARPQRRSIFAGVVLKAEKATRRSGNFRSCCLAPSSSGMAAVLPTTSVHAPTPAPPPLHVRRGSPTCALRTSACPIPRGTSTLLPPPPPPPPRASSAVSHIGRTDHTPRGK